jgi:hypothetical protein
VIVAGHALSRCSAAFVDSLRHLLARDMAWSDSQVRPAMYVSFENSFHLSFSGTEGLGIRKGSFDG